MSRRLVLAAMLAITFVAAPSRGDQTFAEPTIDAGGGVSYRLDRCLHWETLCECAAAREYCHQQGFRYLHAFTVDYGYFARTGQRTAIIGDPGVLCPDHHAPHGCDSFSVITCSQTDTRDGGRQCGKEGRPVPLKRAHGWTPAVWESAQPSVAAPHAANPSQRAAPPPAPVTPGGAESTSFDAKTPTPSGETAAPAPFLPPLDTGAPSGAPSPNSHL